MEVGQGPNVGCSAKGEKIPELGFIMHQYDWHLELYEKFLQEALMWDFNIHETAYRIHGQFHLRLYVGQALL
jgi:hypothetical protein